MKKFNRPVTWVPDDDGHGVPVRAINLPREGHGLEGAYDVIASRDAMYHETYEAQRRRAVSDGVRYWILIIAFWVLSLILALQLLAPTPPTT